MNVDLNQYKLFVAGVTSDASADINAFLKRMEELSAIPATDEMPAINYSRLLTAGIGMGGESGEFNEIVKKIVFHGKTPTPEVYAHLLKELGDQIWYWTQACIALSVDPNSVIATNVSKLESRYPGGVFDVWHSENREENDI